MSIVLDGSFLGRRGLFDNKMSEHFEPDKSKLNKRGLSDVITSVMLILVGLVAVGIIGAVILNVSRAPSFSPAFNCLDWKSNQVLGIQDACYLEASQEVVIKVKRTLDEDFEVEGFSFILEPKEGESLSFGCGSTGCLCDVLGVGNSKNYYLDVSGLGRFDKVVLGFEGCELDREEIKVC